MEPKQKLKLDIFICVAIFIVLAFFAIGPLFKGIKDASEKMALQRAIFSALEMQETNLKNFQANYPNDKPILTQADDSFIDFKAPINFIEFLEKQAVQNNIYFDVLPIAVSDIKEDPWQLLNFQITIGGEFPDCRRFLEAVENGPFLIDVFRFEAQRIAKRNRWIKKFDGLKTGDVVFNLNLKTFSTNGI